MKNLPTILSGQIKPLFFCKPDGVGTGAPGGDATNSQQPKVEPDPDPFEGLDLDLFPEDQRKQIEDAKKKFSDLKGQASAASKLQSRADQLEVLAQKQQALLQDLQNPVDKSNPPTAEQIVAASMKEHGIPDHVAKGLAPAMAASVSKLVEGHVNEKMQQMAPLAEQSNATAGFLAMQQLMGQPYMQHPEVVEAMKGHMADMLKSGAQPNVQVLHNIGAMEFGKLVMAGKINTTTPTVTTTATPTSVVNPLSTMFGIPMAPSNLNVTQPPKQLKPEVTAAMAGIEAYWDKIGGKKK